MLVERIVAKYFLFTTSSCHTLPPFVVVFIVGVGGFSESFPSLTLPFVSLYATMPGFDFLLALEV